MSICLTQNVQKNAAVDFVVCVKKKRRKIITERVSYHHSGCCCDCKLIFCFVLRDFVGKEIQLRTG